LRLLIKFGGNKMKKEKPYLFEFKDGRKIKLSLEEFSNITNYNSYYYSTTENIILTIIDYSYEKNVLIANTNLDRVPIFNDRFRDYYSGIVSFDPFVSGVICLEDKDYYNKKIALSCIGHTFTIPTNTLHSWLEYEGDRIIDYMPSYDDIIDTSWDGKLTK